MLIGLKSVGLSYSGDADLLETTFRHFCVFFDSMIYGLLGAMYQIFFNVASADIFGTAGILEIYKRFQLIIGVFMVFQLALIIIKGIFNVEEVSGSKNSEFIKRVIISLSMLTLLTPINIPNASNEFEKRINNNGILFGVLYSLQYRVLKDNTIGRLVLGTSASESNSIATNTDALSDASALFTNTLIKSFIRINLKSDSEPPLKNPGNGEDYEILAENRMCPNDITDESLKIYTSNDSAPADLFSLTLEKCSLGGLGSEKRFQFTYTALICGIVGIIFVVLLASFTIDIAIRSIKLAVLRIIAPIPIILYIDPKGGKDSGFNSWLKTLFQTYLELFIRLAVIYFVIFVINEIASNGLIISNASGIVGAISTVLIFIGLFIFAKEAPKFIQNAIGLKSEPGGFFSGLGKAAGVGAAIAGGVGSFRASMLASKKSDETRDLINGTNKANRYINKGKHIAAGIGGSVLGMKTGLDAAASAKDHNARAALNAQHSRNVNAIAKGSSGSSIFGRAKSGIAKTFTGEGLSTRTARDIAYNESQISAVKAIQDRATDKAAIQDKTRGILKYGNGQTASLNYQKTKAAAEQAKASNSNSFTVTDDNGNSHTISIADWEINSYKFLMSNATDYISKVNNNDIDDVTLDTQIKDADKLGVKLTNNEGDPVSGGYTIDNVKSTIEYLQTQNITKKRENAVNEANDKYSDSK